MIAVPPSPVDRCPEDGGEYKEGSGKWTPDRMTSLKIQHSISDITANVQQVKYNVTEKHFQYLEDMENSPKAFYTRVSGTALLSEVFRLCHVIRIVWDSRFSRLLFHCNLYVFSHPCLVLLLLRISLVITVVLLVLQTRQVRRYSFYYCKLSMSVPECMSSVFQLEPQCDTFQSCFRPVSAPGRQGIQDIFMSVRS